MTRHRVWRPARFVPALVTVLTVGALGPASAAAQFNSVPIVFSPAPGALNVWTASLMAGRGLNDESGQNWAAALYVSRGFGSRFTLGAGAGFVTPRVSPDDRELEWQAMVNAAVGFVDRRIAPGLDRLALSLQVGAGRASLGDGDWEENYPVALAGAYVRALGGLALESWLAPRLSVRRVERGDVRATRAGFGLSAGANLGFSLGISLQAALDWTHLAEETVDGAVFPAVSPLVLGAGLRYRF